ncbi:exocyst complex component 1-like [Ambystoma mexicanum]|uniref:exocyst complex component 1-like n=1 Tax=Ambystoma mexicanum TaxID=8296 RepID=UPI0037E7A1AA
MAASLRSALESDVFRPKRERLLYVLQLVPCKENEDRCLCVSVTRGNSVRIICVHMIQEKTVNLYKIEHKWLLKDLTLIDGKDGTQDNRWLDLHFEKVYNWEACTTASKYAFVRRLRKLKKSYYQEDIELLNFDTDYVEDAGFLQVPEDIVLALKLCLQAMNCVCLLSCL